MQGCVSVKWLEGLSSQHHVRYWGTVAAEVQWRKDYICATCSFCISILRCFVGHLLRWWRDAFSFTDREDVWGLHHVWLLFLHIIVSVFLFVSCQIIKIKFGELEGYDTSMSMEHIYIIYNVVQYIVYSIFISRETWRNSLTFWEIGIFTRVK